MQHYCIVFGQRVIGPFKFQMDAERYRDTDPDMMKTTTQILEIDAPAEGSGLVQWCVMADDGNNAITFGPFDSMDDARTWLKNNVNVGTRYTAYVLSADD